MSAAVLPATDALSLACAAVSPLVDEYGPVAFVGDQTIEVRWSAWADRHLEHNGKSVHLPPRYSVSADVVVSTYRTVFA